MCSRARAGEALGRAAAEPAGGRGPGAGGGTGVPAHVLRAALTLRGCVPPRVDAVRHKGLAPQRVQRERGDLPRHPEGQLEPGTDYSNRCATRHPRAPVSCSAQLNAARLPALLSLQALLSTPEPGSFRPRCASVTLWLTTESVGTADDPQDAQVAKQYLSTPDEFTATAKFWTESYASSAPGVDAKVRHP